MRAPTPGRRQAPHRRHGAAVALACALAATLAQAQPAAAPAAATAPSVPAPAPAMPRAQAPTAAPMPATPRAQAPAVAPSAGPSPVQAAPQPRPAGVVPPAEPARAQPVPPAGASSAPAAGLRPASAVLPPAPAVTQPAGAPESLQALLARVLPSDPQVRVARSLLQAAEERRVQARSRLAPVAGVSAVRGNSNDIEFGRPLQRHTERAEATLRWNLYNQGNDLAELRGTTGDVSAAAQELRRAREEAAERIALAYADLLRSDELLARADERLAAVSRLRAQVQRQTELGRASEADARQAEASQLDAEIAREQIVADREAARLRLAALTGGEAPRPLPVVLPPVTGSPAAPQPGVVAAAVERAEAARARVRPLASVFAPRIDFEYRQRLSDRTRPQTTTEQQHGWLLSARWEFPVGGESLARRAEGERRAEAAEAEADRLRQVVEAERTTLDPRGAGSERAVAQLDRLSEQYAALLRAGELQYEAGRRTLAQLVLLHDSRFGAEQRRAEQSSRLLATRLRQLALGGDLLPALGLLAE